MAEPLATMAIEALMVLALEALLFTTWSYWLMSRIIKSTPSMASYRLIKDPGKAAVKSGLGLVAVIVIVIIYTSLPGESEFTDETVIMILASLAVLVAATAWSYLHVKKLTRGEPR